MPGRARLQRILLLLTLLTLPAIGCVESPFQPTSRSSALDRQATILSAPASDRQAARYEVDFLTGMIDHHAMAVTMAQMCLDKGALHSELETMCASIITSQSAEIEQMQAWLEAWYGVTHEPDPGRTETRLARLSGVEFETRFLELMIRHHARAVRGGGRCAERAEHEELIALCESVVQAQLAEIAQLESWLCLWYGRCRGGDAVGAERSVSSLRP